MIKKKAHNIHFVTAKLITSNRDLQQAYAIREEVFMIEQKVPREDEFDEFEEQSFHFLATIDEVPVGAARWRTTDKGIKLERFAVKRNQRGKGVGKALVQAVLDHIHQTIPSVFKLYLHAQLDAVSLYAHFGFKIVGEKFIECDIEHRTMELMTD